MELLYQVKQVEEQIPSRRFKPSSKPVCDVSLRNLVAFTSYSDLSKKEDNELSFLQEETTTGSNVYVADLNTPWECFLVKNHSCCIVHLNWDNSGVQLLIATQDGQVEVYGMLEDLLNKWKLLYSGTFAGEPILTSCWLSASRQVCIVPDKQDSMLYNEKYHVSAIRRGKGMSKSLEGAVVVTATGLVGAIIRSTEDTTKAFVGVEKVDPVRSHIHCADFAYSKEGYIALVTSGEALNKPIATCRIDVSLVGTSRDKVEIQVGSLMSFYHKTPSIKEASVSSIKFLSKVNPLSLVVALKGQDNTALLSLYELSAQPLTMKPRFQSASGMSSLTVKVWQQTRQISFPSPVQEMCTLPCPISLPTSNANQTQNMNQQLANISTCTQPLIAVSLSNGNLHLVRADCLQQVGLVSANNSNSSNGDSTAFLPMKRERDEVLDAKQPRTSAGSPQQTTSEGLYYVSLKFTWSGCLLLTLDVKSQLHLYKIHANIDASTVTSLIELSMMGGLDPWDIMMCIRPNLIESITDRLSETFARQPPAIQSHYNTRILVIKAALHRLTCGSTSRTNDQQTLLTLHLVSGALKALLRPGNLSSPDRGPAESLSNLLSTKGEALSDVDKVLPYLEAKQYAVEAPLLQSLQQFLQWCADLSLKLLAILPDLRHSRAPGWEVCRDSKAIGTLRELIVLMRIWGLIRPACLPSFRKTSDSLDVLPLLFRLLTKLSISPHDPDETLIDLGVVNRVTPESQHKWAEKNTTAYVWLYVALGFGGGVLICLAVAWLWLQRKNKRESIREKSNNSFLPTSAPRASSILEGSLTTSTVQPRSESRYDKLGFPAPGKGMTFGAYSQPPSAAAHHLYLQNEALLDTLNEKASNTSSSNNDTGSGKGSLTKTDSLDYYYEMDQNERTPLQAKVADQRGFNSYLHLTTVDLARLNSIPDSDEPPSPTGLYSRNPAELKAQKPAVLMPMP